MHRIWLGVRSRSIGFGLGSYLVGLGQDIEFGLGEEIGFGLRQDIGWGLGFGQDI